MTAPEPRPKPTGELQCRLLAALEPPIASDLRDSVAETTWKAYQADLADFEQWCRSRRRTWSTPETICEYFRSLEHAGAAYSTIERRKTAITKLCEIEALVEERLDNDPTKHPKVAVTLKAMRRRLGTDLRQSTPLTADRLIQVLLSIDAGSLAGRRDIAMLLVGFYGAFRRSELAGMRRDHFEIDDHGVVIQLPRSKASQEQSVWVPIHRQPSSRWDPVRALEEWTADIDASVSSDAVWLRVTKGDKFAKGAHPVSGDAINNITGRRVLAAGLDNASTYSAHSLRAGFVTEAKNRGIDEADIMKHSRHKSLQQMRSYDRMSGWWNRNATAGLAL